jgi:flagellar hook protein FlgE
MNPISSIARSGMAAAGLGLQASAHNIANAQTPAFRRQQVALESRAEGGVAATLQQAEGTSGDWMGDLATDLVQQMAASHAWQANVMSLRTADRMLGSLLDVHA